MKINELPRQLYTTLNYMYVFDKQLREYDKIKFIRYKISRQDNNLLKKMYSVNNIWHKMFYRDFKKLAITISILQRQDIIWAGQRVVDITNVDLYNKINQE